MKCLIIDALYCSSGQTRPGSTTTEAESYLRLAVSSGLLPPSPNPVTPFLRVTTEDHALDSYQNLLFSIARFHEVTGRWPSRITVVGYEMKRRRFEELHRQAMRWPRSRFSYVGIDAAGDGKAAQEGEVSVLRLPINSADLSLYLRWQMGIYRTRKMRMDVTQCSWPSAVGGICSRGSTRITHHRPSLGR